jgi:hypothetical protein
VNLEDFSYENCQTVALHEINSDSARNYPFIGDESTGRKIIPPGFTSAGKRYPPEGLRQR